MVKLQLELEHVLTSVGYTDPVTAYLYTLMLTLLPCGDDMFKKEDPKLFHGPSTSTYSLGSRIRQSLTTLHVADLIKFYATSPLIPNSIGPRTWTDIPT